MKRAFLIIWFLITAAIGGMAWWYLFAPGAVPDGQRPLGNLGIFRKAFNAGVERTRVVAFFSPTTPDDLVTAQYLQALLMEYENNSDLEAHIVWQPLLNTDWAPTTDGMARVSDPRARQYWIRGAAVRDGLQDARVFFYSRGAALDKPALRVSDWKASLPEIRKFLGTPKPMPNR